MAKLKRGRGRPSVPDDKKQKYQRIAVHHDTYLKLKVRALQQNKSIASLINELLG